MKPYYSLGGANEASPKIFNIQTTPIGVNWTKRKNPKTEDNPEPEDTCAKIKKRRDGKKGRKRQA